MRYAYHVTAFLVVLTISIAGFRGRRSSQPPVEVFPDMKRQAKYKPQAESKFFADGRADRPLPAGVVPRGRDGCAGSRLSARPTISFIEAGPRRASLPAAFRRSWRLTRD